MITPQTLSDLRLIMRLLKTQATKVVIDTTDQTSFGRFMLARLATLDRIDVYLTAAVPGDSMNDLRDSINLIGDEQLAKIDGNEAIETLAIYFTAKDFGSYLV